MAAARARVAKVQESVATSGREAGWASPLPFVVDNTPSGEVARIIVPSNGPHPLNMAVRGFQTSVSLPPEHMLAREVL